MDPTTLMQLIQHLRQQGQMQPQGQMPPMQGQMPQMGQMPPMGAPMAPQGQMPSMSPPQGAPQPGPDDPSKPQGHGGGLNPLMLLSPLGGLFASNPKAGLMTMLSPMAGLMGAFK